MSIQENEARIQGNLAADPDVHTYSSGKNAGKKLVKLRIATSRSWKKPDSSEYEQKTQFHNVTIFNHHFADLAAEHLKKGMPVLVRGELQTESYEKVIKKDGQAVTVGGKELTDTAYRTIIAIDAFNGDLKWDKPRGGVEADSGAGEPSDKPSNQD
jgi:single-strand DNA-binding protein